MNPPRRRRRHRYNAPRRSRRYRRNPNGITQPFLWDAVYVTGGYFATRFTANFIVPMLPPMGFPDGIRIIGKGLTAWLMGWGGQMILGRRAGQLIMLGGFVETLSDAVRTYISPFVPALADDMAVYPTLPMGVYPQLGQNGYDAPWNVGQNQYDEAL